MPDPTFLDASPATITLVYAAVFIFVFVDGFFPIVPGETTVSACVAFAVDEGLAVWPMFFLAFAGAILGDCTSYSMGRWGGDRIKAWVRRYSGDEGLTRAEAMFDRNDTFTVAFDRMIPGVRFAVTIIAGARPMALRRFLPLQTFGAAAWALSAVGVSWLASQRFEAGFIAAQLFNLAIAALAGYIVVRRERNYRKAHPNWREESAKG